MYSTLDLELFQNEGDEKEELKAFRDFWSNAPRVNSPRDEVRLREEECYKLVKSLQRTDSEVEFDYSNPACSTAPHDVRECRCFNPNTNENLQKHRQRELAAPGKCDGRLRRVIRR